MIRAIDVKYSEPYAFVAIVKSCDVWGGLELGIFCDYYWGA